MLKWFTTDKQTMLEKEINSVLRIMETHRPNSVEYRDMAANLRVLYEDGNLMKRVAKYHRITIAVVVGNILGLAMILGYERASVITSKAIAFVMRGRV